MAKSIFEILQSRTVEVEDKGKVIEVTLPKWFPSDEIYSSRDNLIEHLETLDIDHAIIQSGIRQELINLRAWVRSGKQAIDYKPTIHERPKGSTKTVEKMSDEQLIQELIKRVGKEKAALLMGTVN